MEKEFCKDCGDYTLLGQVNWWLRYIMDTEVATEDISGTISSELYIEAMSLLICVREMWKPVSVI